MTMHSSIKARVQSLFEDIFVAQGVVISFNAKEVGTTVLNFLESQLLLTIANIHGHLDFGALVECK